MLRTRYSGDGSTANRPLFALPEPLCRAAGRGATIAAALAILLFIAPRLLARIAPGLAGDLASTDDLHAILVALALQWSLVGRETRAGQLGFAVAAAWVLILLLSAAAVLVTRGTGG